MLPTCPPPGSHASALPCSTRNCPCCLKLDCLPDDSPARHENSLSITSLVPRARDVHRTNERPNTPQVMVGRSSLEFFPSPIRNKYHTDHQFQVLNHSFGQRTCESLSASMAQSWKQRCVWTYWMQYSPKNIFYLTEEKRSDFLQ